MIMIILIALIMALVSIILIFLNIIISKYSHSIREKKSTFECGFETFQSMRLPFSIHFFFIAILFLIFDVEIIFFYSMIFSSKLMNYKIWLFCSMMILIILLVGLEYEKKNGPLKWLV